jgi:aspartate aminotransferase-like enzyme
VTRVFDDGSSLLLMTPGPTRLPQRTLDAGAQPMIHHRTPAFSRALVSVIDGLRPIFGTQAGDILPIHTTGRGGMEAAITNLLSAGDEVIACCNGKFGEMWAGLAESYNVVVHRICTDWEHSVAAAEVERALDAHPGAKALTIAYGDTSTGVQNDVASVLKLTHERNVLGMVDGISSVGGMPFAFDSWGADVVVTASQKCLMASPGIAFVAVSRRAWTAWEQARLPRNYWDFDAVRKSLSKPQPETPGTAPVHIVLQLAESIAQIHEEGLPNVFARHAEMARIARERTRALGLSILCPTLEMRSATLTALRTPEDLTTKAIRDALRARGILVAGGLGAFTATSFRIGHMGDIRPADVEHTCAELGAVLTALRQRDDRTLPSPASVALAGD